MRIRKFRDEDARKLSYLIRRTLYKVNIKDYPKSVLARVARYNAPSELIKRSRSGDVYVIVDGDRILGIAGLENNYVFGVFVDPAYHGEGIGRKLMDHVERVTKKRGIDSLTLASSLTAVGFYEKLGYKNLNEVLNKSLGRQIKMEKKL
jgi:ribosomal protein S18 acetylase RimI-like enzyme